MGTWGSFGLLGWGVGWGDGSSRLDVIFVQPIPSKFRANDIGFEYIGNIAIVCREDWQIGQPNWPIWTGCPIRSVCEGGFSRMLCGVLCVIVCRQARKSCVSIVEDNRIYPFWKIESLLL